MTKLRPPLTYENALARIADRIGWARVAKLAGLGERAVRNWGDPDIGPSAGAAISLDLAERLDTEFRAAGGEDSPLLQCFAIRIDEAAIAAVTDMTDIIISVGIGAQEHGEAAAATLAAAVPGADPRLKVIAERELEQCIIANTNTLAKLRAGRGELVQLAEEPVASMPHSPGGN
ncbi:MAG TPA: hypothetical protein VF680_01320 [Allosphingosinicella sp.]|jgi:hypothetical protein